MAVPILAIGMVTILLAFMFRARVEKVQREERKALDDAGVDSYLGYVVGRVNDIMDDTDSRRRRLAVAEDHRAAAVRWTRIAGDVSVEWALAHHEEIETAARLRKELANLGQISATAPSLDDDTTALAQALIAHLGRLRTLGSGGESLPLVLDDPFTEVPPSTKLTLMELLARTAGSPQVVLLTDQDEVATWARLEALTGEVALVEPQVSTQPAPQAPKAATTKPEPSAAPAPSPAPTPSATVEEEKTEPEEDAGAVEEEKTEPEEEKPVAETPKPKPVYNPKPRPRPKPKPKPFVPKGI